MTERRIVEYKMLRVSGDAMTTEAVNKEIADGFQPYGSKILIETGSNFFHFYMPMVRYAEPEPEAADEIERLRAEIEHLRSALKPRVANISEDQLLAAWAAWDDCHDGEQANNPMRAALEASHLVFVRRALQIADQARVALADQTGGAG